MGKGGDKVGTDGEEWSEVSLTVIMNRGRQCIEGAGLSILLCRMALWKQYIVLFGGFHDLGIRSEPVYLD